MRSVTGDGQRIRNRALLCTIRIHQHGAVDLARPEREGEHVMLRRLPLRACPQANGRRG